MTDFKYKTYRELQEDVANMQSSNTTITPEQVEGLRKYRENIERDTSPIPSFYYMREGAEKSPLYYTNKPFGSSQYDPKNISLEDLTTMYENPNELRAMAQPWYDQLANGAAKAVLTAANTFVSGTAGLIWGLGSAVTHWDFARLWDNSVINASQGFSDWMEENLANYRTKEEQETPFNFGSMNFWADTILKNVGFAVGAFYSGKLFTGALGMLAKGSLGVANKLGAGYGVKKAIVGGSQKIAPWVHAITSSVGEGSIEAVNNSRDKFRLAKQQLDDQFREMQQAVMEQYGDSPEGFAELEKLGKAYDESLKTLEQEKIAMGNMDLLWNIPILTFSNWIQFGKYIGRGFTTAKKNVKVKGDWGNYRAAMTNKGAKLRAAKAGFSEGAEEWSQSVVSDWAGFYTGDRATDNIISNFQNAGYNYQATVEHYDWMDSLAKSLSTNFLDPQAWEEFFVGALYGITGIPIIAKSKKGNGYRFQLAGGSFAEYKEAKKEQATQQYYADYMNRVAKKFAEEKASDQRAKNYWVNIIAHNALEKQKEAAALNDDAKGFKDAEFQEALRDIIMFDTTGNLNTLKEQIKEMADMSDEEIANLIEATTDKKTAEQQRNEDQEKVLILSKQLDTLEKNNQFVESQLLAIQDKIDETYEEPQTKAVKKKRKNLIRQKNELVKKYGITEDADAIIERARGVAIDLEPGYYIPVNSAIATEYDEIQAEIDKLNTTINNNEYKDIVTGPFVQTGGGEKMTVEEARAALKQKLDNNATNIDLYIKANNELQLDLGPNLSQDEADLMIYLKAQQYNWAKRAKELFKEIHNTLNGLGGDTLLQEKAKIQNKMAELESAGKKKSKEYEDAEKALMFIDVAEQALTALLTEDKNEDDTLFKAAAFFTNPGLLEFIDKTSNKYLDDIAQVLNTRGIELPQKIADLKKIGKGIQEFSELYKKYKENPDKLSEDVRVSREGAQAAAVNKAANDLYKKLDFTDANTLTESLDNYKEAIERVGGIEKLIPFMSDPEKSLFNSLGIRGTLSRGLTNLLNKTDINPDIASAIVDKAISEITTEALSEKKLRDILNGVITVDSIDEILQDSIVDDLERRNTAEALARDAVDALSKQEGTNDFDLAIDILHNALNAADAEEAAKKSRDERIKEEAKEEGKEAGAKADEMEKKAAEESKAMAEEASVTRKEEVEPKEPEGSPQEEPKKEIEDAPQEEPEAPTPPVHEDPIDRLHEEMSEDEDTSTTDEDIDDFADNVDPPQSGSSNKVSSYPNRPYVTEFPITENKDFRHAYYYDLLEEALDKLKENIKLGSRDFKEAFLKSFPRGLYNNSLDNLQNYRSAVIFTTYVKVITMFLHRSKAYDYVNNGNLLQDIKSKGSKFILDYNEELQKSLRAHIKDALEKENFNFSETDIPIVPVIVRVDTAGGTQILGTYYSKMDYEVSGQKDSPAKKLYDEFLDRLRSNPSSKFNVGDIVKFDGTSIVIDKIDSDGNLIGHFTGDKHPVRVKKADFNRLTLFKAVKPQSTINNPIELEITESDLRFGRAIVGQVNMPVITTEGYEEDEDNLEVVVAQYDEKTDELKFLKQNPDGTVDSVSSESLGFKVADKSKYKTGQQYLIVRSKNTGFGVPMLLTSTIVEKGSAVSKEVSLQIKEIADTLIKEFTEAKDDNEKKDAISKSLSDIKKLLGNKDADIDIGRFENNGKDFVRDFDISNTANKIHLKLHGVGIQVKYSDIESIADNLIDALTRKGKRGFEGLTTTISLRRMNDPKYREEVFSNTNSNLELTHMGNEWFTFKVKEDSKKEEPKTDPIEDTPVNPEPSSKPADPITEDSAPDVRMDPEEPKPARANTKGNNRYSTEIISNKKNKRRARETTKTLTTPTEKINLDEELSWIDTVLPQMSREGRVQLKKGLIKMQESGKDAWGMFDNGVITLSDMAATGTTYHEAFHAVFNMYLSDKVQEDLFRQARRRYGNIDDIALEEAMAEEFRLYIQDKLKTGFTNKLKSFFKDLGIIVNNWFRVRPSINKYFLDISRGKFANKTDVNSFTETRLREEEYTQEMRDILANAPRDSQGRLLAPNGKVSNLTERQYAQVRTKAFKEWFGDWENDPTNASKVIDENGEPLVVYHESSDIFNVFDTSKKRYNVHEVNGIWASPINRKGKGYGKNIYPLFVNLRNPVKTSTKQATNIVELRTLENKALKNNNSDGAILDTIDKFGYETQYYVKNPNQVKSATENIGTFDPNNPDIRYREAVDVNNEKQLKSDIESFLGNFGIKINELSEFDSEEPLFNALDRVVNYTNIENLTENAGYAIAFMMQHSPEFKELVELKKGFFEYDRLSRNTYFKKIGKDIAEQLRKLYSGEKINTNTNIFKKIWNVIVGFFNSVTPEARAKLYIIKHHTQNIANSIKLGDYTIIRKSEFKPGTTTRAELVDIGEVLKNNPYEEGIISTLNKYGIALGGSASIAAQGTLFRPSENPLHDLDFNAANYAQKDLERILRKNFKAFKKTNEIVNSPNNILYTYLILNREFEEREDYTDTGVMIIYDKTTRERLGTRVGSELVIEKEGVEGKMLDFFTGSESGKHGENVTLNFNGKQYLFSNYKNAMAFKVDIAREKDIWDYNNFMPNETGVKTLSEIRDEKKGSVKDLVNRAKIIWGHPAIGKTTYLENNQDILEWDQEVNDKRNRFVREQIDPSYSMDITSTKYKKLAQEYLREWSSHPEYVEFITTEWNNLKQRAFVEGKKLFASPLVLAQLFKEDFDLFVALPEKQFLERDIARGNYRGSSLGWKQAINNLLVEVDQDKLVYTTKYFSDFMRDTLGVSWGTLTENERSLLISEGWSRESFNNLSQSERDAMVNRESETIEKYSKFTASLNNEEKSESALSKAQEEAIDKCEV